jgi:hypothetical protein
MTRTDLCRVCLRRPATTDGICDDCRAPWPTDAPTWAPHPGKGPSNRYAPVSGQRRGGDLDA